MTSVRQQKTLVLLDGNALLHRAWHAIPPLVTTQGLVVNAVYGFANVLEKMLPMLKPDYMAVAWDLPGKTFRHEAYEPYKAQREKKAQELYDQIPLIQKMLSAYHIPSVSAEGFEADDVIGTLATRAAKDGFHVQILTGDLDALQLVDDNIEVLFFQKGISETKTYDIAAVEERYGFSPSQLIDYKALRGDASDNLPGVAGIGEKSATELIQTYTSLAGMYKALHDGTLPAKYAKKLGGENETVAMHMLDLVTIRRDVPLAITWEDMKCQKPDWNLLLEQWRTYEFRTLVKKHGTETHIVEAPPQGRVTKERATPAQITILRETDDVHAALRTLEGDVGVLVATQPADLFGTTIAALGLSDGTHTCVLVRPTEAHRETALEYLQRASKTVTHDTKHLMHVLGSAWLTHDDVMIGGYVLYAGRRDYSLAAVAQEVMQKRVPEWPTHWDSDASLQELGRMCALLPELAGRISTDLEALGMTRVYRDIEMPLVPVLYDMEVTGVLVDAKALNAFSQSLAKRLEALESKIQTLAGVEFNVNSPSQLSDVLFTTLGLPTKGIKKTQSGFSTAAPELEKLEDAHAIIPLIGEYREMSKLKSTYADVLPTLLGEDKRIHTTFNQTVAATGRLSSSDPNLQNIPIKSDLGNEIRRSFIAGKGKRLVSADYSQIELRLAAILAHDTSFLNAFKDGADIHTRTASEVWNVPESEVTPEQRRQAKAVNFGILYGMGQRRLSHATGMNSADAQAFIDAYFTIHHPIRTYIDTMKKMAHEQGYVETLFGRRRSFPEITSGVPMLVAQAERMAVNMPMQGTQADIIKLAMIAVHGWLKQSGWNARLILTVHDELVIECDTDTVPAVTKGLRELMEGVAQYDIPLVVDVAVGETWADMEDVK